MGTSRLELFLIVVCIIAVISLTCYIRERMYKTTDVVEDDSSKYLMHNQQIYYDMVEKGKNECKQRRIIICGLARDMEAKIPLVMYNIKKITSIF